MTCPWLTETVLLDDVSGKLDAGRRMMLEQHAASCQECAAARAECAAVWNALDLWEPERVSLDFNRKLWQKIDSVPVEPWYRKLVWRPALPLAAAAALIIAGFVFDHRNTASAPAGTAVSSVEAEQAEKALDDLQLLKQLDSGFARPM